MLTLTHFSWLIEGEVAGSDLPRTREDFLFLKKEGIKSIVSLTENAISRQLMQHFSFSHLHLPIPDFFGPTSAETQKFLEFASEKKNQPVLVHCFAGVGRTGTMLAIYLVAEKGMKPLDAIQEVRSLRPGSLQTDAQEMSVIEAWAEFTGQTPQTEDNRP